MRKLSVAMSLVFLAGSTHAFASDICDEAAKQFAAATEAYLNGGSNAFMERVLKNGPLEGDKRAQGQLQGLNQVEQFFGAIQSSSVISKKPIGTKTCYLVGVLEYANGPAFAVATYYRGTKGVGATSMFFKTEPETVFPNQLLVQ
jgi:hypothetical protein